MNRAYEVNFDVHANDESTSFRPKGPFIVQAIGTITSGVTFTVQQTPVQTGDNSTDWVTASGTNVAFTNTDALISVNYVYGFKYRIARTAGTQNANDDISFYVGVVPTTDFDSARNSM